MEFFGDRSRFTDGPEIQQTQTPRSSLTPANHCKRRWPCAHARFGSLGCGLSLDCACADKGCVGLFRPEGSAVSIFFWPRWGPVGPVEAAARRSVPISVCAVCGHCPVRSTSPLDAGHGGREGVRSGRTGMLGGGRARLVRLGPRSLTPDFLLSASVWRCVNVPGS